MVNHDVQSLLKGDPGRLRQALMNLVGNALNFTEKGRVVIHVKLDREEDRSITVSFIILDNGISISEEKQQWLFHSLFRRWTPQQPAAMAAPVWG